MNSDLRKEIISMAETDQQVLRELADKGELRDFDDHPKMREIHERNSIRLQEIIQIHGWPGKDLVGVDGAEASWLIVQHSVSDLNFMKSCVPLLEKAVSSHQIEGWQLAFLQDRVLTMSGEPQIYGTQFDDDENGYPIPFPIADERTVNQKRRKLGLNTLEERREEMRKKREWLIGQQKKAKNPITQTSKQ